MGIEAAESHMKRCTNGVASAVTTSAPAGSQTGNVGSNDTVATSVQTSVLFRFSPTATLRAEVMSAPFVKAKQ